jgi:hypothetical protein
MLNPIRQTSGVVHELDISRVSPLFEELGLPDSAFRVEAVQERDYQHFELFLDLPPVQPEAVHDLLYGPFDLPPAAISQTHKYLTKMVNPSSILYQASVRQSKLSPQTLHTLRPNIDSLLDTIESTAPLTWQQAVVHLYNESEVIEEAFYRLPRLRPSEFKKLCNDAGGLAPIPLKQLRRIDNPQEVERELETYIQGLLDPQAIRLVNQYKRSAFVSTFGERNGLFQDLYIPSDELPETIDADEIHELIIDGRVQAIDTTTDLPQSSFKSKGSRPRPKVQKPKKVRSTKPSSPVKDEPLYATRFRVNDEFCNLLPIIRWLRTTDGQAILNVSSNTEVLTDIQDNHRQFQSALFGGIMLANTVGAELFSDVGKGRPAAERAAMLPHAIAALGHEILAGSFVRSIEARINAPPEA